MGTYHELNRTVGKLTNRRVVEKDGREWFDCTCSCGGRRLVLTDSFNNAHVTCCEACVEKGVRPVITKQAPPRVQVSLDQEPLARLGADLGVKANVSGALVRSLLHEYGQLVRLVAPTVSLPESVWEALLGAVKDKPKLLDEQVALTTRVYLIAQHAGLELETGPAESAVILAAIRWGLDHPEGRWWEGKQDDE